MEQEKTTILLSEYNILKALQKEKEGIIEIPETQLETLLDRIKQYEEKEDLIAQCATEALNVIGLIDPKTGQVLPELKEGKNVIGPIMKAIKENFSVSDFLWNKSKAEADLKQKFSFFQKLLPIFSDYVDRKQRTTAKA